MRGLIINTSERIGGAAIAANRLMEALKGKGIKAKMLVRDKQTDQVTVVPLKKSWRHIWQFVWERVIIWKANPFKKHNLFAVDIASMGTDITSLPEFQQADVIHLHWINQGMLSLKDIQKIIDSGKPVVWTMHDMWPITGIVTFAIRYWGSYTEGVSFALLFMNLWVPYINDLTRQTPYGYIKPAKKAKEGAGK